MQKYQCKQYIHKASHVEHRDTLHCTRRLVGGVVGQEGRTESMWSKHKSAQTAQVSAPMSGTWSVLNWDSTSALVLSFYTSYS